ncbi:hypothetical protein ACFL26_00110 [Patescibacteria group bacterium]
MIRYVLFALAGLALFALTGCESELRTIASGDASQIGSAVIGVYGCMFLMLFFCSDAGLVESLLGGARLTGLAALLLSPFRLMGTPDIATTLALAVGGLAAVIVTTVILRDAWYDRMTEIFKRKRERRSEDAKEREVDELRDELRTARERLDQQEARLNRQERRADGQEGPYGR